MGRGTRIGNRTRVAALRAGAQSALLQALLRQAFAPALSLVLLWLLWERFAGLDLAGIRGHVATIGPLQWLFCAALTALSFWAVGRYDVIAHRISSREGAPPGAALSGMAAIAVAQSVGFGIVSGALMRWRLVPGLSLLGALRLSALVALSFLAGWAVVSALALVLSPSALPAVGIAMGPATGSHARVVALSVLAGAALFAILNLWRPGPLARLRLPPLAACLGFTGLALLDTLAAGAALYVLLPPESGIGLALFLPVFLLALGAGLISGTPGGVGPFEITLVALLPQLPDTELLGAVLAYRAVYYALPALFGAAIAIAGPRLRTPSPPPRLTRHDGPAPGLPVGRLIDTARIAEAQLLRQGRLGLLQPAQHESPALMAARSGQSLIALRDPLAGSDERALTLLEEAARRRALQPVLYKAGARMAAQARRAGWKTLPVAREAWLDAQDWTLDGRARRQLRRKLRRARDSGVTVETMRPGAALPIAEMQAVSRAWSVARGRERGFSMGVFDPATLPHAIVLLARQHGRLVGFLTLHATRAEQALDLMRFAPEAPDGSLHLALETAIRAARGAGCQRFSLAAVPAGAQATEGPLPTRLRLALEARAGSAGLRQFKQSFDPNWERLYLCAPGMGAMALGALDILREVMRPVTKR